MSGTSVGALLREARKPKPTMADRLERFIAKVEVSETGCWLWTASLKNSGYAQYTLDRTAVARLGHRVAYELFIGPIPEGLTLDHLCRNRRCVNPTHLEPVTMAVNSLRGDSPAARNARKTHCPKGHPYNEANTCFSGGGRYCRACARDKMRRRSAR